MNGVAPKYHPRFYEPDDIFEECVAGHNPSCILQVLCDVGPNICDVQVPKHPLSRAPERGESFQYSMFAMKFAPISLGIPSSGIRSWVWFSLNPVVQVLNGHVSHEVRVHMFKDIFFCQCVTDASLYTGTLSEEVLLEHKRAWNAKAGTDLMLSNSVGHGQAQELLDVSTELALLKESVPFGDPIFRVRLATYMKKDGAGRTLTGVHAGRSSSGIVNLSQNAGHFYHASPYMPRLLTNSFLYSMASDQEVVPFQHWIIQGFPYPCDAVPERLSKFFPFPDIVWIGPSNAAPGPGPEECPGLPILTDKEQRHATGMSFHWAGVGSLMMWAWATSRIRESDSDHSD